MPGLFDVALQAAPMPCQLPQILLHSMRSSAPHHDVRGLSPTTMCWAETQPSRSFDFPASSAKTMVSKTVSSPKTQSLPITGKTMERASYSYGSVAGGIPRIMLPDQDFRSPPSVASQRSITNTHWRALYMKASITKALKTHRMDCAVLRQDHGG